MKVAGTKWQATGIEFTVDFGLGKGFQPIETLAAAEDGEDWARIASGCLSFTGDGKLLQMIKLPDSVTEEQIQEAVKEGAKVEGRYLVEQEKPYSQTEEDKVSYESGTESDNPADLELFNTLTFDAEGRLKMFALFGYVIYEQLK